jgi:cytochrome c-type biogenesis protein CcmH
MISGDKLPSHAMPCHATIMLSARVSRSGDAVARSGDLQGKLGPVPLGQQDATITIDGVVP